MTQATVQTTTATSSHTNTSLLCPKHRQALLDRGLSADWIETNCRSLTANEASQYLGYPAKSAGILLKGQDLQIQFKPDKPWKNSADKKAAKYRSPLGDYDAMLPVHPTNPTYWTDLEALKAYCYYIDGIPCLIITEGFFKAIAGCSNNFATAALLGVEMGMTSAKADSQGRRYLVKALEKFAQAGFGFIIAFDADCATNKNVILAQFKLSEQLIKFKVPVYSVTGNWSIEEGKGMDDYIQNNGADQFKQDVLAKAISHEAWLLSVRQQLDRIFALKKQVGSCRYSQRYEAIKEIWGSKLRLNTLKQQVELDGDALDLDFVRLTLSLALNIDIPKEEAIEMVLGLARENQYCPVAQYLRQVEKTYRDHKLSLDTLASLLLHTQDPLHASYLKRHLIGSVARALNPGCKMDTALILQGNQGIHKSTFFNVLYGDGFFDDTMTETGDKDEIMKLHQHWAVEWAEFESTLSRRGYSRLKAFMTTKVDSFRPPYGRTVKSCLRHSVLIGSTNEAEFLSDPSGDRRFWVIPVEQINIKLTQSLRDLIWAAAVQAYESGEPWWLTQEEKLLADEANKPFRVTDTWSDFIESYIKDWEFVTTAQILSSPMLDIEPAKQDKASQMRVSGILRSLGWKKGKRWHENTWQRGWVCPDSDRSTDPPLTKVDREVDRCQEACEINTFSHTDPPDPPFTQTFSEKESCINEQNKSHIDELNENPINESNTSQINEQNTGHIDELNESHTDESNTSQINELNENHTDESNTNHINEPKENCLNDADAQDNVVAPKKLQESLKLGGSGGSVEGVEMASSLEPVSLLATDPPRQEIDYSSYPHLTCDTTEAKRNQAQKLKQRLLSATSREELSAIKQEFSNSVASALCHADRYGWVWEHLLTNAERAKVEAVAATEQLNLLSTSPVDQWMTEENLQSMADSLAQCDDAETLAILRECWSAQAMNAACKLLTKEQHTRIKQWVIDSNTTTP